MRSVRRYARQRVVIHTADDQSLRGFLRAAYRDHFVLSDAEYLAEGATTAIEGDAVVLRSNVAWLQILGSE